MKSLLKPFFILSIIIACKPALKEDADKLSQTDFKADIVLAFGSCNHQDLDNKLWDDVLANKPSHWIWGGDVIYSDTDDMSLMAQHYAIQEAQAGYGDIQSKTNVEGTWDDHDYGLNDGGLEFVAKKESQQLFLDFLGVPEDHERRKREGVYYAETISTQNGSVKLIVLDTRYFRTALTKSSNPKKRYDPNPNSDGTILGDAQWEWLNGELKASEANFNIIMTSIQFLSWEHGFESWGTMPHEVEKLKTLISLSGAKGVIVLSGDRHISEFSKTTITGLNYPLIDFTSSGLTHSYDSFSGEPNPYRVGNVVSDTSFGIIKFNFKSGTVVMQMRGDNNRLQQQLIQVY